MTTWQEVIASKNIAEIKSALLSGVWPDDLTFEIAIDTDRYLTAVEILLHADSDSSELDCFKMALDILLHGAPMPRQEYLMVELTHGLAIKLLEYINHFIAEKRLTAELNSNPALAFNDIFRNHERLLAETMLKITSLIKSNP